MSFWANIQQNNVSPPAATIPVNLQTPVISGSILLGSTLTCDPGLWGGSPTPALTYQWRRGSTNISGATGPTYVTVPADQDLTITCRVTATNTAGASSAVSNNSITPRAVPTPSMNPVVSGEAVVGGILGTTNGTWAGSAPFTYAYQWRRNGAVISGQTGNTYTVLESDQLAVISCDVTATNVVGNATASSNSVTVEALPKIVITYGGSSVSASNAQEYTFTLNVGGNLGADRYIVVAVGGRGGNPRSVTAITINGNPALILGTNGTCDDPVAIARSVLPIPDGTSVSVKVTFNAEMARYGAVGYGVRTGAGAPVLKDTILIANASGDPSGTIDVEKYGGLIAAAYCGNGNTVSTTWTGVTENADFSTENSGNRFSSGNYMNSTADETGRRVTANFTANNDDGMVVVSLTPD